MVAHPSIEKILREAYGHERGCGHLVNWGVDEDGGAVIYCVDCSCRWRFTPPTPLSRVEMGTPLWKLDEILFPRTTRFERVLKCQ